MQDQARCTATSNQTLDLFRGGQDLAPPMDTNTEDFYNKLWQYIKFSFWKEY